MMKAFVHFASDMISQCPHLSIMSEHVIDASEPYHPKKLAKKSVVDASAYFALDIRIGVIVHAEIFQEMRKPSYKIEVDFGPIYGRLRSSAQITNYTCEELIGRSVVGAVNLSEKKLPGGFVSQFLVLGALHPDGTVALLELSQSILPGSIVA